MIEKPKHTKEDVHKMMWEFNGRCMLRPQRAGRVQRGLIRILNVYLVDWKVLPSGGTYSTRAQAAQEAYRD